MTARTCARVRAGEPAIKKDYRDPAAKNRIRMHQITGRRDRGRPQQSRRARRQLR